MAYDPSLSDSVAVEYTKQMVAKNNQKKKKKSKYTEGIDDSYVEQFLTDANSYSETIEEILKGVNYGTAGQIYEEQSARADDLRQRAGRVMAYLDENRESYDPASYDSMRSQIEAFQGDVAENKGRFRSARDHYAQWETEDDYNTAVRESAWLQKYQGKSYADLKPMLDALGDGEEKQWLTDYAGAVNNQEKMTLDLTAADREIQELAGLVKNARDVEAEYNHFLRNSLLMLTRGDRFRELENQHDAFLQKYGSIDSLEETLNQKRQRMAEASQLQEQIKAEEEYAAWTETVRDAETIQKDIDALNKLLSGNQDQTRALTQGSTQQDLTGRQEADAQRAVLEQQKEKLQQELQYSRMRDYAALMNNPDFAQKSQYVPTGDGKAVIDPATGAYTHTGFEDIGYDYINKNEMAQLQQFSRDNASGMLQVGLDRSWLLELTEDEVGIYNYLRSTQGEEAAQEFIDFMRPTLTKRQRGAYEEEWAGLAKENPVIASGISILQSPMRAASFLGQAIYRAAGREIDQNAGYNRPVFANNAIRNEVSNTILESGKWGALGSFGYQTAMSMGDFVINAVAGQGVSGISTAIMGSGAAADTVIRSKDRGLNDDQAFGLGIVAGLSEALTERISLEALLNPDILKNGIPAYVLKNSLTEGSEEVASSIINLFTDIIVTKEKSEWQKAIRGYQQQGYSEGEALGKAVADQAESLGMDFLGGALSGFVMSGARGVKYGTSTAKEGRSLERRGLTDADQLQQILDAGHNAEKGTYANAVAARLQKKIDAGRKLSTIDKGQLYQVDPQTVREATVGKGSVRLADTQVQGIDNDHEDWKTAVRLAEITGRDIRFYNGSPHENGYYRPDTKEIYINVDRAIDEKTQKQSDVAFVFAHELTHSTEIGKSYDELLAYVRSKIRSEGRNWDTMIQKKKDEYAAEGHPLKTDLDAEKELVAEEMQRRILINEQELRDLFWHEPTLGEKFVTWCDRMLARCKKGDDARERVYIHETRERMLQAWISANKARRQEQQNRGQTAKNESSDTNHQDDASQAEEEYRDDFDPMYDEDLDEWQEIQEQEEAIEAGEAELGRQYSISRTKDMEWDKQIRSVLQKDGYIIRNDTLVVDETPELLKDKGISDRPLAIPLSIITKAKSGKDVSHSISNKNLRRLQQGIRNASAIIHDPKRNSIAFVTNIEQNGAPVLVAFQKDVMFDGDQVHKATSIHLQMDVASMLNALPPEATVYVQNKNELNKWVGVTNNLRSLAANVEFTEDSVADLDENVKQYSLASATLNRKDVARDLRAILSRGGSAKDLQRYVDSLERSTSKAEQTGENRDQTGEKRNTTARDILRAAHEQGQSVEEYLRWNPEQFERDGKWRPEALEAMRMEQGGRRYSLNVKAEDSEPDSEIPQESTESQANVIQRDSLDKKGRELLRGIESRLINSIGRAMNVPRYARYKSMNDVVQEMADEYLAKGTISEEKTEELFDKAYASGVRDNLEFFDKYKDIQNMIKSTAVTLTEEDRKLIPQKAVQAVRYNMRVVDSGGITVEKLYHDLRERAPELFQEYNDSTVDKLVRIAETANDIRSGELSLQEHYGENMETYRKWKMNDFRAAMEYMMRDLRDLRRYANDQTEQSEKEAIQILSPEDAEREMEKMRQLRKAVDDAERRNALTTSDQIQIGRLLKGEIQPEHLDQNKNNVKGILAVYTAKLAYEEQSEVVRAYKSSIRAERNAEADELLETANEWKDKSCGILYARETMIRNIRDIVNDRVLAEKINRTYFEPVQIANAKMTRFLNEYRSRVNDLKLSRKVHKGDQVNEAYAVQFLGEAMDNIQVLEKSRGRIKERGGKTLDDWRAEVTDFWMNNQNLDKAKIEGAIYELRKIYDEILPMMNKVLVANGYEPVPYRRGYFPHFQEGSTGLLAYFGKLLGMDTRIDALPTTINGLTHTFKPGKQWFGHGLERSGNETTYDALQGFDIYIEGAAGVIFQTENIQKLRAFENRIRYRTSDKGIQEQVDAILRSDLTEEQKQVQIEDIYSHGRTSLSNFAVELREYTNLLANKKSKYDRGMEHFFNRRMYTFMKNWENQVGANMIAANFSSAMTNWIPLISAASQLNTGSFLQAIKETAVQNWDIVIRNGMGDGLIDRSDFLTNRRGSQRVSMTGLQKAGQKAGILMEMIDNSTSEIIVRSAYLHNLKTGLSEAEAMHQADLFAAGVMGDRSKGAMPTLFESRNPLFKAFTQFQLEVNNQFSEITKDIPRRYLSEDLSLKNLKGLKREELEKYAGAMLMYWLLSYLFNDLYEKFMGRRPALDPLGILNETVGDLTGYEVPNVFDTIGGFISGERASYETEKVGIGEAAGNFVSNVVGELPFSAGLTMVGFETDGGRLPVASTIPDFSAVWDVVAGKDLTGAQRWDLLRGELEKFAYVLPPFAGGQILKSWKGVKAWLDGGSYSLNQDGDEILQYPVYKDKPEDAFWSLVRAVLMGKNSLPEAQDWVENGYNSLNQLETAVYKDMLEAGAKDRDAFKLIQKIAEVDANGMETGEVRRKLRGILARSDFSQEVKAVAYYGLVATEEERDWMDKLTDAGVPQETAMTFVSELYDAEYRKGTEKKRMQYTEFLDTPMTEEEKKIAVGFVLGTDKMNRDGSPTQYAKFLTAMESGLTVDKYMELRANGTDIEDYLELTDVGIKGDEAADLAISMTTLEPEDGYDNVSWIQRCQTVMDSDMTEEEKIQALQTVDGMYESTYEKIVTGHNLGMNVKSYIDLKSIMPQFDENGNGKYTQAETEAAINALAGDDNALFALTGTTPNGYTLTDREKAILWQLQDKRWSPKRNPFDKEVGQMVYEILTAEDSDEASMTAKSGAAFDLGSLFSKMK